MILLDMGFIPLITPVVAVVIVFFLLKELLWIWGTFLKTLFDKLFRR